MRKCDFSDILRVRILEFNQSFEIFGLKKIEQKLINFNKFV